MSNPGWHTGAFPELRPGPPWVMQEMIAAQPALVEALLDSPPPGTSAAAEAIAAALDRHDPVIVCGCGTSEHAAHGIAALMSAAIGPEQSALVRARPALSAALDPAPGACLAVSHDGETRASTLALLAARAAGAHTVAITHQRDASVARAADSVLLTPRHDESWCHTVAYTSALAAGAGSPAVSARLSPSRPRHASSSSGPSESPIPRRSPAAWPAAAWCCAPEPNPTTPPPASWP
jgi:fructoselysine-6-P-deglycase FrlB-like protein